VISLTAGMLAPVNDHTDQDQEQPMGTKPATLDKPKPTTPPAATTPVFDRLITELGDPVVRPPVDRSYAAILAEASTSK
jgi:hypothetical protein